MMEAKQVFHNQEPSPDLKRFDFIWIIECFWVILVLLDLMQL